MSCLGPRRGKLSDRAYKLILSDLPSDAVAERLGVSTGYVQSYRRAARRNSAS